MSTMRGEGRRVTGTHVNETPHDDLGGNGIRGTTPGSREGMTANAAGTGQRGGGRLLEKRQ